MEKMKETDLAEKVILWLQDQRWDVYQEVTMTGGSCADIVAVQGKIVWIIECKMSASLSVVEQAYRWSRTANYVSVAVPKPSFFFEKVCRKFGIGVLSARREVNEIVSPKLIRISTEKYRSKLLPEHKTYAKAGNADGRRWSPFKNTCLNILNSVRRSPGICMKDLIASTDHHYHTPSTARQCLVKFIEAGIVPGVKVVRDGRFMRVYPE